jgi:hypothetical protein
MARMAESSGLSAKEEIALTGEDFRNTTCQGRKSRLPPLPKAALSVRNWRAMTPTVDQSSAPVAQPWLLELSRQVAVDFQPDADFDERRRCPGHGFLPFLGQYRSQRSAYPGGLRIQEIKIIAFIYDPGSGCHRDPSTRPTGIALPSQHADPHDDRVGPRGDPRVSSLLWPGKSSCETSPAEGTATFPAAPGRRASRCVFANAEIPWGARALPLFGKGHSDFRPVFQEPCFDEAVPRLSRSELTLRSIGLFNISPAIQACERTIL